MPKEDLTLMLSSLGEDWAEFCEEGQEVSKGVIKYLEAKETKLREEEKEITKELEDNAKEQSRLAAENEKLIVEKHSNEEKAREILQLWKTHAEAAKANDEQIRKNEIKMLSLTTQKTEKNGRREQVWKQIE